MKIDRLIGIVTILLQKEKVTIPQLSERFEVSSRTIQRDIDSICQAGIPIISMQGYGGGLTVADGYKLDKTILTKEELQAILTGIKSIDSVSKTAYGQTLIEKFSNGKNAIIAEHDMILIDLASWYQDSLTDKIEKIKQAILNREQVSFLYYSDKGESERTIEPYLIAFKWAAWYVYGYCLTKQEYRLFKLNRLWKLERTKMTYVPRDIPEGKMDLEQYFQSEEIRLMALFQVKAKYRLIEEYGPECFTISESGKLLFRRSFSNPEYLVQWILSFGDCITVIDPPELRETIKKSAKNILSLYE
ncbi:YafY family protein [Lachnospiraceae bacterium 54-53]